jgi:uncharacterized membrane protein (DUF485 family)
MNATESSSNALDERISTKEQRRRKFVGGSSVVAIVLLSYVDLLTDILLAVTLLGTKQAAYGVVSFGILGFALFMQAFTMTVNPTATSHGYRRMSF